MSRTLLVLVLSFGLLSSADAAKPGKAKAKGGTAHVFDQIDANHDGKVTLAEFTAFAEAHHGKSGKTTTAEISKRFSHLDVNGDGAVTRAEYQQAHRGQGTAAK